ncbi:MAG: HIT domain-containing protein [Xanthobacteraceae bacterium]|nr:HIT domain-containing protein [Xanthobacteraceae bacterium]
MTMTTLPHWELDPQLARDTATVGDLARSRVLVSRDASYPWLILVPRQPGAVELIDLSDADQAEVMREIAQAGRVLKAVTACDKLNIAAIGNVVAQLHIHVVARRRGDAAWPKPIWGAGPARSYTPDVLDEFITMLRRDLGL